MKRVKYSASKAAFLTACVIGIPIGYISPTSSITGGNPEFHFAVGTVSAGLATFLFFWPLWLVYWFFGNQKRDIQSTQSSEVRSIYKPNLPKNLPFQETFIEYRNAVLETDSEFANLSPHQMYLSYHFYKENLKGQAETISPKARLENLKDLRKNKLISEAEYKSAKQRILDTI